MPASCFPASLMAALVTAVAVAAQILPVGTATLLVRVHEASAEAVMAAAMATDATLLAIPAPGYAVLRGDAVRIRASLGMSVLWKGAAPCSPSP